MKTGPTLLILSLTMFCMHKKAKGKPNSDNNFVPATRPPLSRPALPRHPAAVPTAAPAQGFASGQVQGRHPHTGPLLPSLPPRTAPWPSFRHGCPRQLHPHKGSRQGRYRAVTPGRTQLSRKGTELWPAAPPPSQPVPDAQSGPERAGPSQPEGTAGAGPGLASPGSPRPRTRPGRGPQGRPAAPLGMAAWASPPLCRSRGTGWAQSARRGVWGWRSNPGAHLRAAGGACPSRPPSSPSSPLRPLTSHPGRSRCRAGRSGSAELRGSFGRGWDELSWAEVRWTELSWAGAVPLSFLIQPCATLQSGAGSLFVPGRVLYRPGKELGCLFMRREFGEY